MPTAAETGFRTVGASVTPVGVTYRVWAPARRKVEIEIGEGASSRRCSLVAEEQPGYWSAIDEEGAAGDLYKVRIDDDGPFPDVASRFQPRGVDGPSECIDPYAYRWSSVAWVRPGWRGQVIYEVHVGTFTPEGTFRAAISKLAYLRDLGVQAMELMPVADFNGGYNWGYDGVALFAPARCYGRPDDLRALVDAAHDAGIAVILDVVYNHIGPKGSYLDRYSEHYLAKARGDWGSGFNLDGPDSGPVREFILCNAAYWLDEFRIDGFRLDATHAIADSSPKHLLSEIAELARSRGAFTIAEDARNLGALVRGENEAGIGVDAIWADDFHHEIRVCMTGTKEGYYSGYSGQLIDIADTVAGGWFYRGQSYVPWKGAPRGTPCSYLEPERFVYCLENHDQVGNRAHGERLSHLVSSEQFRSASAFLCLAPHPPLIFMGQEWSASAPFLYFTSHGGDLGRAVFEGRRREHGHDDDGVPNPEAKGTFIRSKIDWSEASSGAHAGIFELYRLALHIRRSLIEEELFKRSAWSVSAKGRLISLRFTSQRAALFLSVALHPNGVCRIQPGPAPFGRWSVLINSNWTRFGGNARDGFGGLDIEGAGAIALVSGQPLKQPWPSS